MVGVQRHAEFCSSAHMVAENVCPEFSGGPDSDTACIQTRDAMNLYQRRCLFIATLRSVKPATMISLLSGTASMRRLAGARRHRMPLLSQ
jgi:hypothetical protein